MRISYHEDTDSLYIHLLDTPTAESEEVAPDTVLHFDGEGNVTGLEIYWEASKKANLSHLEVSGIADGQATTTKVLSAADLLLRSTAIGNTSKDDWASLVPLLRVSLAPIEAVGKT